MQMMFQKGALKTKELEALPRLLRNFLGTTQKDLGTSVGSAFSVLKPVFNTEVTEGTEKAWRSKYGSSAE